MDIRYCVPVNNSERSFNWRVIDQIEKLIDESGKTRAEIIKLSGFRRNTFFVKMRGETAMTTDDIAKIARALGYSPELLMRRVLADENVGGSPDTVAEVVDLHTVDLSGEYGLAASHDDSAVNPDRN